MCYIHIIMYLIYLIIYIYMNHDLYWRCINLHTQYIFHDLSHQEADDEANNENGPILFCEKWSNWPTIISITSHLRRASRDRKVYNEKKPSQLSQQVWIWIWSVETIGWHSVSHVWYLPVPSPKLSCIPATRTELKNQQILEIWTHLGGWWHKLHSSGSLITSVTVEQKKVWVQWKAANVDMMNSS